MSEMDEQTRMVRFESMRKGPGARVVRTRSNKNKKLFLRHKDLQKQCDSIVRKHEHDHKMLTADLRHQQLQVEKKKQKLKTVKVTVGFEREKTHYMLDRQKSAHVKREQTTQQEKYNFHERDLSDKELLRAISQLRIPKSMRSRLRNAYHSYQFSQ